MYADLTSWDATELNAVHQCLQLENEFLSFFPLLSPPYLSLLDRSRIDGRFKSFVSSPAMNQTLIATECSVGRSVCPSSPTVLASSYSRRLIMASNRRRPTVRMFCCIHSQVIIFTQRNSNERQLRYALLKVSV